jgi:hypothetical protein
MAVTFSTTADARLSGVKLVTYGPAGYGKTMLTATLPSPFLISIEKGLLSLTRSNIERVYGVATPGICYDIPTAEITSFADMAEVFDFLTKSEHARGFESVALDSISDIAEVCLAASKKTVKDPRQAYGDLAEKMAGLIRSFRDLPGRNVYFSAKQEREKDEVSGAMLYAPSMPGKELTKQLPHFVDEVFALGVSAKDAAGHSYRFLRTQPDPQFFAKDRSGCLAEIEEPHLGKIIAKIKAAR